MEQESEKANQPVEPSDCEACPLRRAVMQKAKVERRPVKLAEVRRILSSKPDRQPAEGYPECSQRLVVLAPLCCGQNTTYRVCDHIDSYQYGAEVNASICSNCPLKGGGPTVTR